jgi:hypothetical protein
MLLIFRLDGEFVLVFLAFFVQGINPVRVLREDIRRGTTVVAKRFAHALS